MGARDNRAKILIVGARQMREVADCEDRRQPLPLNGLGLLDRAPNNFLRYPERRSLLTIMVG
jgi:hypothetical protein